MQSQSIDHPSLTRGTEVLSGKAVDFQTCFQGYMEMHSDLETVGNYLKAHQGWFRRCAQPMKTQSIAQDGYIIVVGRFGAFGYDVEPKMAVILHPPDNHVYLMNSIPIPDYKPPGYDVDYNARMELEEVDFETVLAAQDPGYLKQWKSGVPSVVTKVNWVLNLKVSVQFPKFIYRLSSNLIQSTGDRLLNQIIRSVSPRLTYKVQQDFHSSHSLPLPPKYSRGLKIMTERPEEEDEYLEEET